MISRPSNLPDCIPAFRHPPSLPGGWPKADAVSSSLYLMDRRCDYSGHPDIGMTNQPHREFIYRAAYELGRHIIGYEIQKVLAAVDALASDDLRSAFSDTGRGACSRFMPRRWMRASAP